MFLVWSSALVCAGAADIIRQNAASDRVEVLDEQVRTDGSSTAIILYQHKTYYYIGPIPIGRYPIAVLSGVALAASVVGWVILKRGRGGCKV
jgi:hypothetical protein